MVCRGVIEHQTRVRRQQGIHSGAVGGRLGTPQGTMPQFRYHD
jgi:hypothetical protein